jgi:shikimate dehydrogenase
MDLRMITGTTRLYAITGDPVAHVRTPMVFNEYFEAHDIDAICVAIHIDRNELAQGWPGLKAIRNLDGFIVTAPHKAESAQLCDELVDDGAHTRVVNTVRRDPDGRYVGTLLDGRGFVAGLNGEGYDVRGRSVYVAGAGGAGTALAYALAGSGVAALTIHNRTRSKAEALVAGVGKTFPACAVRLGTSDASGHDFAVNATSLGLKADDPHSFDLMSVDPRTVVAEVVMKPEITPLLAAAKSRGHAVHFGTHMLSGQLGMMMQFFGLTKQ